MACYTYKNNKYQSREELESFLIEEHIQFQKELGKNGISLETAGFVHKNQIYINSDIATEEVAVHEFGHLWNSWIKQNNPQLYETGIKLIKKEGKKYIEYVNKTQPNLVGERLYEEALAQAIGDNGKQLLDKNWINQVWDFIKDFFGLSQLTNEQIANLSLDEFARAASIDLLRGQRIGNINSLDNDIRYQIIGEQGAQNLEDAVTIIENLQIAKEMMLKGVDAKTIKLATGWEIGGEKVNFEELESKGIISKTNC